MNLLIHDLKPEAWNLIKQNYEGWNVIEDNGTIRPCVGCFSCWNRCPGECIIKDGYGDMGKLIHHADEVVVISRYTYGGFSGFVKNVFDRSLGYVLPQFEITSVWHSSASLSGGESHHQRRYAEDKAFTFIFYGNALTDKEKACAKRYVTAVCTNIRGHVKDVIFWEDDTHLPDFDRNVQSQPLSDKVVILNGSMRSANGNGAVFAKQLIDQLHCETEIIYLKAYFKDLSSLIRRLEDVPVIVFCMPLYVDGLPSQVIRLMERFESEYNGTSKKIYVLSNMGLYESCQLVNLFNATKQWCKKMGFTYCGGLGISAGELVRVLMELFHWHRWATKFITDGINRLADAIDQGRKIQNIYAEPFLFPRWLFILIANVNWSLTAKKNGLQLKDLYRRL